MNEPGSIPSIIKRQSRLSAIAAIFTAISVLAQAAAAFLGAEITTDQKQFVVSSDRTSVMVPVLGTASPSDLQSRCPVLTAYASNVTEPPAYATSTRKIYSKVR